MSRRSTPNVTPFIPPLASPEASPQPPVIPTPGSSGGAPLPPWATIPQHAGNYPAYPSTPYTTTPFIPQLPGMTPVAGNAYLPGSHPIGPVSNDFTGYPQFSQQHTPWGPPQGQIHPSTPWYPGNTPLQPMSTPWTGAGRGIPGYPPAPQQNMYPSMGMHPGMGGPWPGQYTPGPNPADPWGLHAPAWAQPLAPQQAPGGGALSRPTQDGDRMDPFTAGDHYGPVLDPFLIHVVEARVMMNPLVQPPPDDGPDRPFLKWDMIHAANACQRTTDPANISWSTGREEPATFPRVSSLRLVSRAFPWMIEIHARSLDTGVTCGDVIDTLDENMHKLSTEKDWAPLTPAKQRAVRQAYNHNRSTATGVPGGRLGRGLRRLDFLCQESMFGGIVKDDALVKAVCGVALPCTFVVKCIRRYPPTPQEVREQQARQRSAHASSSSSRTPTVTEETDDDEDDSEH